MKKYILTLFLSLPSLLFGQAWEKTYGGSDNDYGRSAEQSSDGGYIFVGETSSFGAGQKDIYVVKTDSQGNEIWSQRYGGLNDESGNLILETNNGYVIAGSTKSQGAGDFDFYLLKTDIQGNELWNKTYGGLGTDYCYNITHTLDGGFMLIGASNSFGNGNNNIYAIKVDSSGNELWSQLYGGNNNEVGVSVIETNEGDYVIAGSSDSLLNGRQMYLLKIDSQGSKIWSHKYGGVNLEEGYSVLLTLDNGFVICGSTRSFGSGSSDVYLVKTDSLGNLEWENYYGGTGSESGISITQTQNDSYIIAGSTNSYGAGALDVYLIMTDNMGNEQWSQTYGGSQIDVALSIGQTTDNGFIIAGYSDSFGSVSYNAYLIKTDSQGNVSSIADDLTNSNNNSLLKIVDLLGRETEPQPNTPLLYLFDDGTVEKRLTIE
jgi:hypothetical protein